MMALGEAAVDLAWLSPCAGSLAALTRPDGPSVWSEIRFYPGCVLLLSQAADRLPTVPLVDLVHEPSVLEMVAEKLRRQDHAFVDWALPGAEYIYHTCVRQARLAAALAAEVQGCDPQRAWVGGLLAPLGWLALAAAAGPTIAFCLDHVRAGSAFQQKTWGLDPTSIARRLARAWRLPPWLTAVVGHLGLHVSIAEKLGADPVLFQVVQLAVGLVQHNERGLALPIGSQVAELETSLRLSNEQVIGILEICGPAPAKRWEAPANQPLLGDLLRLALNQRRRADETCTERLQRDLDQLQQALEEQCAGDKERLQTLKLAALAELAAGAGHEINNPLAVISCQAQYLIKQLQTMEETLPEGTSAVALLESLRPKFAACLQKIVGQTQRIHGVLTELMHFARPASARPEGLAAAHLLHDVEVSLRGFAQERQVRLDVKAPAEHWAVTVDPGQIRMALGGLVRNAIEAAPAEGWASIRVENGDGTLKFIVEDNGPGPTPAAQEHLFDPFFSGRSAGRGRGLGLATSWRLARQHGGNVRFEGHSQGQTRFVLTLPAAEMPTSPMTTIGLPATGIPAEEPPASERILSQSPAATNGHSGEGNGHHVVALSTGNGTGF